MGQMTQPTVSQRAGRVHYEKREAAQHLHFTHTVRQARWCCATLHLSHPCIGPVRKAGLSTGT